MLKYSFPVALGLGAAVLWSAGAQAANNSHYGVVCLKNDTRAQITYLHRVANGGWERHFLAPGVTWKFTHRYDGANEDKSPPLFVKYDQDASSARNFQHEQKLRRRAAVGDTCREGHVYAFQYERANRNFITLELVQ
jgi:hypothetical protein